jgi:hypothetical protein
MGAAVGALASSPDAIRAPSNPSMSAGTSTVTRAICLACMSNDPFFEESNKEPTGKVKIRAGCSKVFPGPLSRFCPHETSTPCESN